jgi:hypothetical protein
MPICPRLAQQWAQPSTELSPHPEARMGLERDYRIQLAMQRHRAELVTLGATG